MEGQVVLTHGRADTGLVHRREYRTVLGRPQRAPKAAGGAGVRKHPADQQHLPESRRRRAGVFRSAGLL